MDCKDVLTLGADVTSADGTLGAPAVLLPQAVKAARHRNARVILIGQLVPRGNNNCTSQGWGSLLLHI